MASMAEHEANMTIYYYKRTGNTYSYCTGINDMSGFGEYKEDYEMMIDYIVIPKDHTIMEFLYKFYVDIETKELKLKPEFSDLGKYL